MNLINAENKGNECILILKRENFTEKECGTQVVFFTPEYKVEFMKMHDHIFPGVYVSSKDILDSLGNKRSLYCAIENDALLGYAVLKYTKDSSAVTVEIIGVDEKYRGKGYGKALLNEVLKQAFSDHSIKTVNLVVENLNTNAMSLYYSFGFELDVENYSYSAR